MRNLVRTNTTLPLSALTFLNKLKKNNSRDWFNKHKDLFLQEQSAVEQFADGLLAELNTHDSIETLSGKKSLYRVYRDVRFSKDKTPYKTNWSGSFTRAGKWRRGSYYYHIQPGNSFIAGGFWGPNPADLRLVRDDIAFDAKPLRKIISNKTFRAMFGMLRGEQVKTSPKGYDPTNEAIDLLRYKQFLLIRHFTDQEVLSKTFIKEAGKTFKAMRPFFDYMSEVLSGDINGVIE